ncbi:MAG: autotransporter-associated beta strand repeat-containing protein [Kiritimatiellia bacterium]
MPGTGDTARFGSTNGGHTTISLGTGVTVASIAFDDNTGGYVIGASAGETLTLNHGGSIEVADVTPQEGATFPAAVVLGTNGNAASYALRSSHSGSTLTLAGHLIGGGTGTGAKSLDIAGAGSTVISGAIGGGGGVIAVNKSESGMLTLSGANTFTGTLTVSAGTLSVPAVNSQGTPGPLGNSALAVTLRGGSTLNYTGATATSTKKFMVNGSDNRFDIGNAAAELTLGGVISNVSSSLMGGIEKAGPGTLILGGANTYGSSLTYSNNHGTTLTSGTLRLSTGGKLGTVYSFLHVNGGILDLGGTDQTVARFLGSGGTILNNGTGESLLTVSEPDLNCHYQGVILDNDNGGGGTVAFTHAGSGDLYLHGANTYSGVTTVGSGATITLIDAGTLGNTVGGTMVGSGGSLRLYKTGPCAEPVTIAGTGAGWGGALVGYETTYAGLIRLSGAATIMSGWTDHDNVVFNITNPGTILGSGYGLTLTTSDWGQHGVLASIIGTGAGTLTKTGLGTWTLTGANTYTGSTTISEGILNIRTSTALGTAAGGVTISNGATLQLQGPLAVGAEAMSLSGAGAGGATGALENVEGDNSYGGAITLHAASTITVDRGSLSLGAGITGTYGLTLGGDGNGSVAGVISIGAATLTKSGAGGWTLSGTANTYTGRTILPAGRLEIRMLKNVGGGASSLGAPTTVANGTIDIGSDGNEGILVYTGVADALSNRVINMAGTTGGVRIDSSGPANHKLVLSGALTATVPGDKTLTLGGSSTGANEISGAIPDSSGGKTSVAKTGAGSWTLSGVNTYTGDTTAGAGVLVLTRAGLADAADVRLVSGATLNLAFTGSDMIGHLVIDDVVQSPGSWGSLASSATYRTWLITGAGVLNVTNGAAQPPYATFAAKYALGGADAAFEADPEGDGLPNGLEWMVGGDPTAGDAGAMLEVTADPDNFHVGFHRNDASESTTTLVAQWSRNLLTWTDAPVGATGGSGGSHVWIDVSENGDAPDAILVSFPLPQMATNRLYVRLKATRP